MTKDVKTELKVESDSSDDGVALIANELSIGLPCGSLSLTVSGEKFALSTIEECERAFAAVRAVEDETCFLVLAVNGVPLVSGTLLLSQSPELPTSHQDNNQMTLESK